MKKYWQVFAISLSDYFTYRLNFILWRVRVVISILITYFLWQSVFRNSDLVFGYSQGRMLTYILLLTLLHGIVLSTQTHKLANEIQMGILSNFLLQPISLIGYNLARDLADKSINTFFSIIEMVLLFFILQPQIYLQTDFFWLLLFIVSIVLASVLFFEISLFLSFIGFWSNEVWAPRFIFYILIAFLAGTYFPLDIFPQPFYQIIKILPFTYIIFFPLKVYLGEFSQGELISGFLILILWLILLYILLRLTWLKGLKIYTSAGR